MLPTGFTVSATTQVAGRGRGSNVWVSPQGALIVSTVINHPASISGTRPIVFMQYLAAVATVEAIHGYGPGYEKIPVRLKWPNDICAYLTPPLSFLQSPLDPIGVVFFASFPVPVLSEI